MCRRVDVLEIRFQRKCLVDHGYLIVLRVILLRQSTLTRFFPLLRLFAWHIDPAVLLVVPWIRSLFVLIMLHVAL